MSRLLHSDDRVDTFLNLLPVWQRDILQRIRTLIHVAEPNIEETIKRSNRPYFILDGNVCAFLAAKEHVNVFIYDPIAPDPDKIINQGESNKTARAIQLNENQLLNEAAFINLVKTVVKNNRAGGWRKLTQT